MKGPANHVRLLGGLRVWVNGHERRLPGQQTGRLLAALVLGPDPFPRDQLIQQLWPQLAPAATRRRLSDTLYRLRQVLDADWIFADTHLLYIQPEVDLWIDTVAFAALVAADDAAGWREALDLYGGDLLPEMDADWLYAPRLALQEQYRTLLERLGEQAEAAAAPATALGYYRRLVEVNPLYEPAYRGQMRCLAATGRWRQALTCYARLAEVLHDELGATPGMAATRLAEQLRREHELLGETRSLAADPPLVGRQAARGRLLAQLQAAQESTGGLVLVLGEAGIGKTRLLADLADAAEWRGWQVAWGRGENLATPAPLTPLAAALRAALPRVRRQQLRQLLPGTWQAVLGRLLPATFTDQPELPDEGQLTRQLPTAMAGLMRTLGDIKPHLFLLDNCHWAAPGFWPLLADLQTNLADMAVLLVVAGRTADLQAQPAAWRVISAWDQAGVPLLTLPPLPRAALAALAYEYLGRQPGADELDDLQRASGGNPLIATRLLAMGEVTLPAGSSSPALRQVLQRRLDMLEDAAQLALQAAAVLGFEFEYAAWQPPGIDRAELPSLAGKLEQAGLIRPAAGGYQFIHDTLRQIVYEETPLTRRRELHRAALRRAEEDRPDELLELLDHARGAGAVEAVGRYALLAAERARRQLAHHAALAHYQTALDHLAADAWPQRYQAQLGRFQCAHIAGERDEQRQALAALSRLTDHLSDPLAQLTVLRHRADFAWLTGDQEAAAELARLALTQAEALAAGETAAALQITLARIARNRGDRAGATAALAAALRQYTTLADTYGQATTLDKLANLAYEAGAYEQAADQHREAARLFREIGAAVQAARAENGLALVRRAQGDFDGARSLHEAILASSRRLGDRILEWMQMVNLGNLAFELGDFDAAATAYEAALPLIRQLEEPFSRAMVLFNLGEAGREGGRHDLSQSYYEAALALYRAHDYRRGVANARYGLALLALAAGDAEGAVGELQAVAGIWETLAEPLKRMETAAALALAWLAAGDAGAAAAALAPALDGLDAQLEMTHTWRWVHYAAFRVSAATGRPAAARSHLSQAVVSVARLAQTRPDRDRDRLWQAVPLHRDLARAAANYAERETITLPAVGRDALVAVTWTVSALADAAVPAGARRRRHVVRRLRQEAAAQGARATDAALAAALGVSRRTILRDRRKFA